VLLAHAALLRLDDPHVLIRFLDRLLNSWWVKVNDMCDVSKCKRLCALLKWGPALLPLTAVWLLEATLSDLVRTIRSAKEICRR
jgi:hypothetical protein